jgi:hypothetical protein
MKFELLISIVVNILVEMILWIPLGKLWGELFNAFFRIGLIIHLIFSIYRCLETKTLQIPINLFLF